MVDLSAVWEAGCLGLGNGGGMGLLGVRKHQGNPVSDVQSWEESGGTAEGR